MACQNLPHVGVAEGKDRGERGDVDPRRAHACPSHQILGGVARHGDQGVGAADGAGQPGPVHQRPAARERLGVHQEGQVVNGDDQPLAVSGGRDGHGRWGVQQVTLAQAGGEGRTAPKRPLRVQGPHTAGKLLDPVAAHPRLGACLGGPRVEQGHVQGGVGRGQRGDEVTDVGPRATGNAAQDLVDEDRQRGHP